MPSACRWTKDGAELAFLAEELWRRRLLVVDVFQVVAVDLLGHIVDVDFLDLALGVLFPVVPGQVQDRLRELAAFFLVEALYPEVELVHDLRVGLGLADRIDRLVPPLRPPARVRKAAFFFHG